MMMWHVSRLHFHGYRDQDATAADGYSFFNLIVTVDYRLFHGRVDSDIWKATMGSKILEWSMLGHTTTLNNNTPPD